MPARATLHLLRAVVTATYNDLLLLVKRAKIKRRQRQGGNPGAGWITIHLYERRTMSYLLFCAIPRAPAIPSPLLVNAPPFWVAAAVAFRFACFPSGGAI